MRATSRTLRVSAHRATAALSAARASSALATARATGAATTAAEFDFGGDPVAVSLANDGVCLKACVVAVVADSRPERLAVHTQVSDAQGLEQETESRQVAKQARRVGMNRLRREPRRACPNASSANRRCMCCNSVNVPSAIFRCTFCKNQRACFAILIFMLCWMCDGGRAGCHRNVTSGVEPLRDAQRRMS